MNYERQYINIMETIRKNGFRQLNERTGVETLRIPHAVITVDLQKEFPILKCKNVFWKTAVKEIMWIMQKQSSNINDLDAHIWDDWADEDGSIGKSYGYQAGKEVWVKDDSSGIKIYNDQVHYVLDRLSKDSSDRRCVIDLWNVDDMGEMNLCPCCYSSIWTVVDGKLNCMLVQRSADYLVGVPFNTTQYAILTHLFARHLGLEVGILTHCMADAHIYCYDSHLKNAEKMYENYKKIYDMFKDIEPNQHLVKVKTSNPKLYINTSATSFWDVNDFNIFVEDYFAMENMKFDVAV